MLKNNILWIVILTALILLIPLIAMQFSNEVNWTLADFVFMGVLLLGAGLAYELVTRSSYLTAYRAAAGLAVVATFLLVWVNGAVGIIGDSSINLIYLGVPAVLIIGATVSRLKPKGMARALLATALTQALIPVIALIVLIPDFLPNVLEVFVLNAFFVMMFVGSSLLFSRAATQYK